MIGVTNAINMRTKWNIDSNTQFLMTDTIEDKSNYHVTLTNNGAAVNNSTKRDNRNSIFFNGSSYLIINKRDFFIGTQDYTIEFWANTTLNSGGYGPGAIFNQPGNPNEHGILLGHISMYPRWVWLSGSATSWDLFSGYYGNSSLPISGTNIWYHFAFVKQNQKTYYCFINGDLIWQYSFPTTTNTTVTTFQNNPVIGAYFSGNNYYKVYPCYIQDFRISNCARYTANFTSPQRFI